MRPQRLLPLGLLLACTPDPGDTTDSATDPASATAPATTDEQPTSTDAATDPTATDPADPTATAPTTDPTATDPTTDTDATATDPTTDTDADGTLPEQLAEGCGFTRPCDDVRLNCGNDAWSEDCTADFSLETQCALERLAAGEAFPLRFDLNGLNGEVEWLDIVFDGQGGAVRQRWLEDPGTLDAYADGLPEACTQISPDMFQACLDAPNADPLHGQCMLVDHWFTACEPDAALTCPSP